MAPAAPGPNIVWNVSMSCFPSESIGFIVPSIIISDFCVSMSFCVSSDILFTWSGCNALSAFRTVVPWSM